MGSEAGLRQVLAGGNAFMRRLVARAAEERRRRAARHSARTARREARDALPRLAIEVELSARLAVRSGMRLEDFLRFRLARYAARLPVSLESLPYDVDVAGGEPVVRARAPRPAPPAPPAEDARLREASSALATLAERAAAARARVETLTREIGDDLAAGRLPGRPDAVDATPEQRGRPPVPPAALPLALRGLSGALLAATGYRLARPALAGAGLPTADLGSAAAAAPFATALALLFGVASAAAVYAFLDGAVGRGGELLSALTPERRRRVLAGACGGALALAALVALAAVNPGAAAEPLLLVAVPFAAALLGRRAAALWATRAAALAAALEWDRARARDAADRARRGEVLAAADAALRDAEAARDAAAGALRALEQAALEAARAAAEEAALTARRSERLAESLAAALELDRYAFLRRASLANAQQGVVPRPLRPRVEPVAGERLGVAG